MLRREETVYIIHSSRTNSLGEILPNFLTQANTMKNTRLARFVPPSGMNQFDGEPEYFPYFVFLSVFEDLTEEKWYARSAKE